MKRTVRMLTALLLCVCMISAFFVNVAALPSDEIQEEIDRLKKQADELSAEQEKIC